MNRLKTYFNVNTLLVIHIIKIFYHQLENNVDFYCGVMVVSLDLCYHLSFRFMQRRKQH